LLYIIPEGKIEGLAFILQAAVNYPAFNPYR
jgi:hypothetical protein